MMERKSKGSVEAIAKRYPTPGSSSTRKERPPRARLPGARAPPRRRCRSTAPAGTAPGDGRRCPPGTPRHETARPRQENVGAVATSIGVVTVGPHRHTRRRGDVGGRRRLLVCAGRVGGKPPSSIHPSVTSMNPPVRSRRIPRVPAGGVPEWGIRHKPGRGKALAKSEEAAAGSGAATRRLPPSFHPSTIHASMHRPAAVQQPPASRPARPLRGLQARRPRSHHRRRRRRLSLRPPPFAPPRLLRGVRRAPDVPAGRRAPVRGLEDPRPERPAVREAVRGGDQPSRHGGVRCEPVHGLDRQPRDRRCPSSPTPSG